MIVRVRVIYIFKNSSILYWKKKKLVKVELGYLVEKIFFGSIFALLI